MDSTFVYWKLPNQTEVYTLQNLSVKAALQPLMNEEGFLFFPFNKLEQGYILNGKITKAVDFSNNLSHTIKPINAHKIDTTNQKLQDAEDFKMLIKSAIHVIDSGVFEKVVLARSATQQLPESFNLEYFFNTLCQTYSQALVYVIQINNEIWIGATPELLLKKDFNLCITNALAGTKAENDFGEKEKQEQLLVKNYIVNLLEKENCKFIEVSELKELNTGNLIHLFNEIQFETENIEKVLTLLHPTPAVCGLPLLETNQFIVENEKLNRKYYSGFLGPISANKNFSFWVNLRCANILADQMTYYSGAGILSKSNADDEFNETELKMNTLRLLVNNLNPKSAL